MELFHLQACVTPHFKGNFVEIKDLLITPIPQNATSVSFCQIGSHMTKLRMSLPVDQESLTKLLLTTNALPIQQTQNMCMTCIQRWPNVGPTLYKCYTNVLCLLGYIIMVFIQCQMCGIIAQQRETR